VGIYIYRYTPRRYAPGYRETDRRTDGRTDGRQDDANSRDRLKSIVVTRRWWLQRFQLCWRMQRMRPCSPIQHTTSITPNWCWF